MQLKKIIIFKNRSLSDYKSWPIWECDPSKFDWEYSKEEHCFVIEGNVTVTDESNTVEIERGDYVVFPKNLKCTWLIHKTIKKHYSFKE